jgi:hypothetical protein
VLEKWICAVSAIAIKRWFVEIGTEKAECEGKNIDFFPIWDGFEVNFLYTVGFYCITDLQQLRSYVELGAVAP